MIDNKKLGHKSRSRRKNGQKKVIDHLPSNYHSYNFFSQIYREEFLGELFSVKPGAVAAHTKAAEVAPPSYRQSRPPS